MWVALIALSLGVASSSFATCQWDALHPDRIYSSPAETEMVFSVKQGEEKSRAPFVVYESGRGEIFVGGRWREVVRRGHRYLGDENNVDPKTGFQRVVYFYELSDGTRLETLKDDNNSLRFVKAGRRDEDYISFDTRWPEVEAVPARSPVRTGTRRRMNETGPGRHVGSYDQSYRVYGDGTRESRLSGTDRPWKPEKRLDIVVPAGVRPGQIWKQSYRDEGKKYEIEYRQTDNGAVEYRLSGSAERPWKSADEDY
jgi:hypothetical protein